MTSFICKVKKGPHQTIEKIITAESKEDALDKLSRQGYIPVRIEEHKEKKVVSKKKKEKTAQNKVYKKVKSRDLTILTSQLASLVKAKVSIIEAINILHQQSQNIHLKKVLFDISEKIKDGATLSEAMNSHPDVFSPLYINIIKAGEMGGILENSLRRLAKFREQEEQMKAKINAALAYPLFIIIVGFLTVTVLLTFVVPKLTSLFTEMGQTLPLPTKILIETTNFMRSYWYIFFALVVLAIVGLKRLMVKNREIIDRMKLKLPLLGTLIKKRELERFANTSKVLLSSGIPVFKAIEIAALTLSNETLKNALEKVQKEVIDGGRIGESLKKHQIFPLFMSDMVSVGERGGTLNMTLSEISDFYQEDVDRMLKVVTALLEPVAILLMGLVIGFIVFAMLLPIFELNMGV
jgi:type II secretory pathway component PulF